LDARLKEDLNFMHRTFSREFSGYLHSAKIRRRENQAHVAAMREARGCEELVCYRKIVSKYVAALQDPHMRVYFSPQTDINGRTSKPPDYPWVDVGIEAVKYNDRYYVKSAREELTAKNVKPGDEIVNCGGKTPGNILKEDIFPYLPVLGIESDYYQNVSLLFRRWDMKEGDTMNCIFSRNGSRLEASLVWKKPDSKKPGPADLLFSSMSGIFSRKRPKHIYSAEKKPYGYWIKLTSLSGDDAMLTQFYGDAEKFRKYGLIVMDIRGNGGGNSKYSTKWIKNFFGYTPESKKALPDLIAATNDNYRHFKELYAQYLLTHPEESPHVNNFLQCIQKNLGELAVCEDDDAREGTEAKVNPAKFNFKGQIYLLTDYRNFSSAEIFVHELRQMPGVTQVGVTTGASTLYGDVRTCVAPSRIFAFSIATKVFQGLFTDRKPGQPFEPQMPLKYDPQAELAGRDSLAEALEKIIAQKDTGD